MDHLKAKETQKTLPLKCERKASTALFTKQKESGKLALQDRLKKVIAKNSLSLSQSKI